MKRARAAFILALLLHSPFVFSQSAAWTNAFHQAEAAFNSRSQYSSATLFESLIQQIVAEKNKRALSDAESILLQKSYDYLGQANYGHGDFAPAYQAYSKLLELNADYRLNEDVVSPKIVKFVDDIRAQLPKKPQPVAVPKPTPPTAPAEPAGSLVITCDATCTVNIDGKGVGTLKANEVRSFPAATGQHLIFATDAAKQSWKKVFEVKNSQVVVDIEFPKSPPPPTPKPVDPAPIVPVPVEPKEVPAKPQPEPAPASGDKVKVTVYRTGDVLTALPSVFMDSLELGQLGRGQYFILEVEPGTHTFRYSGWGYSPPARAQDAVLHEGTRVVSLEPGNEYYMRVFFEKNNLNLISDRVAKPDIASCKPVDKKSIKNRALITYPAP